MIADALIELARDKTPHVERRRESIAGTAL